MSDYIEREAVLAICEKEYQERLKMADWCGDTVAWNIAADVSALPAADVAPVRRGRWEEVDWVEPDGHGFGTIRTPKAGLQCSQCSNVFKKELLWKENYCPNCGARMDGKEDNT